MPQWITIPNGLDRSEVEVRLFYYLGFAPGLFDDTEINIEDKHGRTIQSFTGNSCWHPATRWTPNGDGSFTPAPYPHYMIITVGGDIEVFEHRGTDRFFISDGEDIIRIARESIARGECRHEP